MTLAKHWRYGQDEDLVNSFLKGFIASNPAVNLIESERVIYNPNSDGSKKVCLISGGGSGHEPLHSGYVGDNLLDAAVAGSIFASPNTRQILAAIKACSDKDRGTLVIVKNYTGDILHFGLVVERAKAEGYKCEMLAVTDDVAVGREQNKMVGRRGLAGTAIIHKIMGAASHHLQLSELLILGQLINKNLVTLGASLDRTSVPNKVDEIEFTQENEAELGLGIHNEPGVKLSPIPNIDDLIKNMLEKLISDKDQDRHYVKFDTKNDDYILLVNNIGGTSSLELYVIVSHVIANLPFSKKPTRVLVSDFVTSLNSPGFSITLLNLSNIDKVNCECSRQQILQFLDAPTNAPGWKPKSFENWGIESQLVESPLKHNVVPTSDLKIDGNQFKQALSNGLKYLLEQEPKITHYDTVVGDGDCGETLAAGANSILKGLNEGLKDSLDDPVSTIYKITELVEESMGGTSGGLYSIFLTSLSQNLQKSKDTSIDSISQALHNALYDGLFKYTNARVGGRTLVDTLQPFVDSLSKTKDLKQAVHAAKDGCESTKKLQAKFGRASYVDEKDLQLEGGIPDPGAVGLLALIEGFTGIY